MNQIKPCLSILRFSGPKTQEFLQGQLTCDVTLLKNHGDTSLAACCDHRGRMIATFWVKRWQEDYLLILPETMQEITRNHLQKYAVFSKVMITRDDNEGVSGDVGGEEWREAAIAKGVVILQPKTSLLFTPQMINLQKLGGVSFTKGCYVGQEIIARTEHLGTLKRHLRAITLKTPLEPGDPLKNAAGEEIGVIADAVGLQALAVIEDRF